MKFSETAKSIVLAGTVFTAVSGMAYGAWRIGEELEIRPALLRELKDVKRQVAQNAGSLQWVELENLENKYKTGILSDQEKQKRCFLAYQLQAFYVTDCIWPAPQPIQQ